MLLSDLLLLSGRQSIVYGEDSDLKASKQGSSRVVCPDKSNFKVFLLRFTFKHLVRNQHNMVMFADLHPLSRLDISCALEAASRVRAVLLTDVLRVANDEGNLVGSPFDHGPRRHN